MDKADDEKLTKAVHIERPTKEDALKVNAETARVIAHSLAPWQAVEAYPNALFWCLMVSMCVIMEGYDTALVGNFYAYPQFAERYGQFIDDNGKHQLSAPWQGALGVCSLIGGLIGSLINGLLVQKFGQKHIIIASLILLSCFIFVTFFAKNIVMLFMGQFLCGLPWGVFTTSAPAYATECLPMSLRVYLTSWGNMCFIIGQLIAAGVLAGLVERPDQWAYRIPFALQWTWPVLLVPILCFAPESPWHLVRVGRLDEAKVSLNRLQGDKAAEHSITVETSLAEIIHTNNVEIELSSGTSYLDCFKGTDLRRTEIACMAMAGQILSGFSFAYNSTYFFQQVGLEARQTYHLNLGGTALGLVATFVSWFAVIPFFGRRRIWLCGMFTLFAIQYIIGILNVWAGRKSIGYAQAALTLVWTIVFQISIGQLSWAISSEIGSTRLLQKTIILSRNAYYIASIVSHVVQPYFMNPRELNLRGYTGFIWGSTALIVCIWAFFRLPESKDRTFEELDLLFAKGTPTRKFGSADTEPMLSTNRDAETENIEKT